jgi:hypothetical protein
MNGDIVSHRVDTGRANPEPMPLVYGRGFGYPLGLGLTEGDSARQRPHRGVAPLVWQAMVAPA